MQIVYFFFIESVKLVNTFYISQSNNALQNKNCLQATQPGFLINRQKRTIVILPWVLNKINRYYYSL